MKLLLTAATTLAVLTAAPASWASITPSPPISSDDVNSTTLRYCGPNSVKKCPKAVVAEPAKPAPSSSFMCGHAGDTPIAVTDQEILATGAGLRSLADGWWPAYAIKGTGSTQIGAYHLVCSLPAGVASLSSVGGFTDDSGSSYKTANTLYANPIVG